LFSLTKARRFFFPFPPSRWWGFFFFCACDTRTGLTVLLFRVVDEPFSSRFLRLTSFFLPLFPFADKEDWLVPLRQTKIPFFSSKMRSRNLPAFSQLGPFFFFFIGRPIHTAQLPSPWPWRELLLLPRGYLFSSVFRVKLFFYTFLPLPSPPQVQGFFQNLPRERFSFEAGKDLSPFSS